MLVWMSAGKGCIFCAIVSGNSKAFVIHEDGEFMAFLDLYPNMAGQSVAIPKVHAGNYAFDMPGSDFLAFMDYCRKIGRLLDRSLDCGRTAMVLEGTHVEHIHAKLYPLSGTDSEWRMFSAPGTAMMPDYKGYLTTKSGPRADEVNLKETASLIRSHREGCSA